MDFSPSSLFAGLIYGALGLYFIKQGKKDAHIPWVLIGVALIAYPYFVSGEILTWGIGAGLIAVGYYYR